MRKLYTRISLCIRPVGDMVRDSCQRVWLQHVIIVHQHNPFASRMSNPGISRNTRPLFQHF